ncbi:MAG: hypothetical protein CUN54_01830 [Phototrophicales bacterium]|nr:MAG: hypothetical protein CUN54_01830 [Phototrophicales bacterium]
MTTRRLFSILPDYYSVYPHFGEYILRQAIGTLMILLVLALTLSGVAAQNNTRAEFGDPPIASLITISAPDDDGFVTISGGVGAVFPGAQVAIRNLYTEDVVYTLAGVTGAFSTRIFGPGNTPFAISPATNIPNALRDRPGSLPGGPATIIYAPFPEGRQDEAIITQIVIDGDASEWAMNYPQAILVDQAGSQASALVNHDSLYLAFNDVEQPEAFSQIEVEFSLEGTTYRLATTPNVSQTALLQRVAPVAGEVGNLLPAAAQDAVIEMRIPLALLQSLLGAEVNTASLVAVRFLNEDGAAEDIFPIAQAIPVVDEVDGVSRAASQMPAGFARFSVSGPVAQGAAQWDARGRINRLAFQPGDELILELDITLTADELPAEVAGLRMMGDLSLQPVSGADGQPGAGGINSNNGWSPFLTPTGLAVDNLHADVSLVRSIAQPEHIVRRGNQLLFPLTYRLALPNDLPPGIYVPTFTGLAQTAEGDIFRWDANGLFGEGDGLSRIPLTRLPVTLNIGDVQSGHLTWALLMDTPSDGSRGVLAEEDQARVALSNRVRFNSPSYILPRSTDDETTHYPIEPYILNQLPNGYDTSAAPLVPFLLPGGRISAQITRPDGVVDDLGSTAIVQNQLSTTTLEERTRFGETSPLDVYRLTTLNDNFSAYAFDVYGEYEINLTGNIEDVWGNRYEGGGVYRVVIAELLDMTPGVLPGTPFEVGDALNTTLHLTPGVPANVTITVRHFPVDGSPMTEQIYEGIANRYGYFNAGQFFTFETAGEYVVDYEARYTDSDGVLWAGSLRGAGVVGSRNGTLIAHGRRGVANQFATIRPAWFNALNYSNIINLDESPVLFFPYHNGDVARIADGADLDLQPALRVQDTDGAYAAWLQNNATLNLPDGVSIARLAAVDELPVVISGADDVAYNPALLPETTVNNAYNYISAVRPGISVRQFVFGAEDGGLPLAWGTDDPYNSQLGAGSAGDMSGDYYFLFGGAVVRNQDAGLAETAIYASMGLVTAANDVDSAGILPPYRGQAGGPDGGPLLTVRDEEVELFFHPTGVQPAQRLTPGDTLTIAGQVAPTLPSVVHVTITSPSGIVHRFEDVANRIGYFYQPANDLVVDEVGVWTIEIAVRHEGDTSFGPVEPPFPTGSVLGAQDNSFPIFVVPANSPSLEWPSRNDFSIPPGLPFNFSLAMPSDLSGRRVYRYVTTPGVILEGRVQDGARNTFEYQFNTDPLNTAFSNIENMTQRAPRSGPAASDVISITIAVTGNDADGRPRIQTRTFTIMHDRLLTMN